MLGDLFTVYNHLLAWFSIRTPDSNSLESYAWQCQGQDSPQTSTDICHQMCVHRKCIFDVSSILYPQLWYISIYIYHCIYIYNYIYINHCIYIYIIMYIHHLSMLFWCFAIQGAVMSLILDRRTVRPNTISLNTALRACADVWSLVWPKWQRMTSFFLQSSKFV
jgi:hypothetical protein